jgi:hypothetical protein
MNMLNHFDEIQAPLMDAAKMALETGNVNYILIWVPEESENTLINLFERTCCQRRVRMEKYTVAAEWYFETVNRLHCARSWQQGPGVTSEMSDEKQIVLKVKRAVENGNIEEIRSVIPVTHARDVKERFQDVMNKRNYAVNNIAAGRAYVSAFTDFTGYVHNLFSGISGKGDR